MSRQHSIVTHRANYFFVPLEDDYLAMYEKVNQEIEALELEERKNSGPASCKAMITSILEHWMNSKRPTATSEDDLYVYLTYDEWEQQLRYHYKRSTIIRCLYEMEKEGQCLDGEGEIHVGTIKKKPYIQNTYSYTLNLFVVQTLLNQLPEQSPFGPKPKIPLGRPTKNRVKINDLKINGINSNGITESRVKTDGITEKNRVNLNAPFYTQITDSTDLKKTQEQSDAANAHHIPSPFSENEFSTMGVENQPTNGDTPPLSPVGGGNTPPFEHIEAPTQEAHQHDATQASARVDEEKRPVTPTPLKNGSHALTEHVPDDCGGEQTNGLSYSPGEYTKFADASPGSMKPDAEHTMQANVPGHDGGNAPVSGGGKSAGRRRKTTDGEPAISAEEKKLRTVVLTWVNDHRGYKLYGRAPEKEIHAEYNSVHKLAHMLYIGLHEHNLTDGADWEDMEATWKYTTTEDPYWRKAENNDRVGAYALLQQIARVIKRRRGQAAQVQVKAAIQVGSTLGTKMKPARTALEEENLRRKQEFEQMKQQRKQGA